MRNIEMFPSIAADDITLEQKAKEITREINVRKSVYPRWCNAGKLKRRTAGYRIQVMTALLADVMDAIQTRDERLHQFDDNL